MQAKALELRDEGTFIAILAVDMNPTQWEKIGGAWEQNPDKYRAQRYLLRRCGYPCDNKPNIVITHMSADGHKACNDPYYWGGRTFPVAHKYIIEHWADLRDGDVVDVSFILGETATPKISESITAPI